MRPTSTARPTAIHQVFHCFIVSLLSECSCVLTHACARQLPRQFGGVNHRSLYSRDQCSVRKRPTAQFLFANLPEPRQALGFHNQEEQNEPAKNDGLDIFRQSDGHRETDGTWCIGEKNR